LGPTKGFPAPCVIGTFRVLSLYFFEGKDKGVEREESAGESSIRGSEKTKNKGVIEREISITWRKF